MRIFSCDFSRRSHQSACAVRRDGWRAASDRSRLWQISLAVIVAAVLGAVWIGDACPPDWMDEGRAAHLSNRKGAHDFEQVADVLGGRNRFEIMLGSAIVCQHDFQLVWSGIMHPAIQYLQIQRAKLAPI